MGYVLGAPQIHSAGTIYITYKQAKKHPYNCRAIIQKLRDSTAMANQTRPEEMRWEYRTAYELWPGNQSSGRYVTYLVGRAWHWSDSLQLKEGY